MWTSVRFLIYFSVFGTAFENTISINVKRREKTIDTVQTVPSSTKASFVKMDPIEWVSVVVNEEISRSTTKQVTPTATNILITESTSTNPNITVRKWEPLEVWKEVKMPTKELEQSNYARTCNKTIHVNIPFDWTKMPDVWKTAYYNLKEIINCFKLHIRRVTEDDRKSYRTLYGDFDGDVKWDKIFLEIDAMTPIGRKHFLQGDNENMGVLQNIIITEDQSAPNLILLKEVPDQWLVLKHLLLMRDCETGEIVVFAKIPHVPSDKDIEAAITAFGGRYSGGKHACLEDGVTGIAWNTIF